MRHVTAVCALVAASLAVPIAAEQQKTPMFGTSTEMVNVAVTVTDKKGKFIENLEAKDFQVLEDFVRQDIDILDHDTPPIDLILMIDVSGSMGNQQTVDGPRAIDVAKKAAKKFISSLRPEDRVLVVDFSNITQRYVPPGDSLFTSDQKFLGDVLDALDVRKTLEGYRHNDKTGEDVPVFKDYPTSLYTSLYVVVREIVGKRYHREQDLEHPHRPVIVLLTDGEDTSSAVSDEQVIAEAKVAGVSVYSIMFQHGTSVSDEKKAHDAEFFLRDLARVTGGTEQGVKAQAQLQNAYGMISNELRTQYRLGYTPRNAKTDGTWRLIQVTLIGQHDDLVIHHRQGYYAQNATKKP